jgi:HEAT repeat protein
MTTGREKRVYAWMWQIHEEEIKLLDARDKLEAIPIHRESDWSHAFDALYETYKSKSTSSATMRPASRIDDSYDRAQYAAALRARFGTANLSALYLPGPGYARDDISLYEIFVMPDLEPYESSRHQGPIESPNDDNNSGLLGESVTEYIYNHREGERHCREQGLLGKMPGPKVASEWLEYCNQLLIIGEPGQGKSTLLQYWALESVERWQRDPQSHPLPVYIRLSLWEDDMPGGEARLAEYLHSALPKLCEADSRSVTAWLTKPVLWLLDGIDEIRDPYQRDSLRKQIDSMATQRQTDKWVLTSRPSASPTVAMGRAWQILHLSPFSDDQILAILQKWSDVLLKKESVSLDVQQMVKSLLDDTGLTRIARNALLLTLAVLFYKTQRRLPEDRWEFFVHADRVLRDTWIRHRLMDRSLKDSMPGNYLSDFLNLLALRCMQKGVVSLRSENLEQEAVPLLEKWGYVGRERGTEIQRLIAASEDLIGVLVARGPALFGFLHLTFQEFYAARALLTLPRNEADALLAQYWDHPDWSELWFLYILGGNELAGHIERVCSLVLGQKHPLNKYLFHAETTCLTWYGVGSHPISQTSPIWKRLVRWAWQSLRESDEIRVAMCVRAIARWERQVPAQLFSQPVLETFSKGTPLLDLVPLLERLSDNAMFLDKLTRHSRDKRVQVRVVAVKALKKHASEPLIRDALLARLSDRSPRVRIAAVDALECQASTPSVTQALLRSLGDTEINVALHAAGALSQLSSDSGICEALLSFLKVKNPMARWAVQMALGKYASEGVVRKALLRQLRDPAPFVRQAAAESLQKAAADPQVQSALVRLLRDKDSQVAWAAARSIESEAANPAILSSVLTCIKDKKAKTRWAAVKSLEQTCSVSSVIREAVLERLQDPDCLVRAAAATALRSVADYSHIETALLQCLDDKEQGVRSAAALALGSVAAKPNVRDALLRRLKDKDWFVRSSVAESLTGQVMELSVRTALIHCLRDRSSNVRNVALKALKWQPLTSDVYDSIVKLAQDRQWFVRMHAQLALAGRASEPGIRQALLTRMLDRSEEIKVRTAAMFSLELSILLARHPLT